MTRWLVLALPALIVAARAGADPGFAPLIHPQSAAAVSRLPSLRVIQTTEFDPVRVRRSGVIVDAEIVPRGRLGLGLFTTAPKRPGTADWKPDAKPHRSRRAGVSFRLNF